MRFAFYPIAASLFLSTALAGARPARAQVSNPDQLVAPVPRSPRQARVQPNDDLQWLWQYANPRPNGRAGDLRLDEHFQTMLEHEFKQPQSLWQVAGGHESLATIIPIFLTRYGTVTSRQDRYLTVDGCVPRFCPAAGLLWIDLGEPHALMVFAAVNWTGEGHTTSETSADYNLWLFSNRELAADQLPLALNDAVAQWNARLADAHRLVPHIQHAVLVEPDGTLVALDPQMIGANTIAPQVDTVTPPEPD